MNELIYLFIVGILTIIIHELGHIIHWYYIKKRFPPISINWFMVIVGTNNSIQHFTPRQIAMMSLAGIIIGMIYLCIVDIQLWFFLLYLLTCMMDFSNIIVYSNMPHCHRDIKLKYLKTINTS